MFIGGMLPTLYRSALPSRRHEHRLRRDARRDPRHLRSDASEFLLRVVPLVRPGAPGRSRDARVPDAGMRETDRVRRLREGATAESRRYCAAPSSAALSTPPKKHVEREASRARLTQALTQVASYRFVRPLVVWLGNRGAGAGRAGAAGAAGRE
jgi:hypothetical protein